MMSVNMDIRHEARSDSPCKCQVLVLQYLPWDLSILEKFCAIAMAKRDVFGLLSAEDMLDGTNYPLWSYMMRHVLVAKGF